MEDEIVTISTAVVIPDTTSTLKRPQSGSSTSSTKRLRLSPPSDYIRPADKQSSPIQRDSSSQIAANRKLKEASRGKRLFGNVLGTLGGFKKDAASRKSQLATAKRAELEAKAALRSKEIQRKDNKSSDIAQRSSSMQTSEFNVDDAQLLKKAGIEAKGLLQETKLAYSYHLSTEAKPKLYYLPYGLLPAQEEQIRVQKEATKAAANKEAAQLESNAAFDNPEPNQTGNLGFGTVGSKIVSANGIETEFFGIARISLGNDETTAQQSITMEEQADDIIPKAPSDFSNISSFADADNVIDGSLQREPAGSKGAAGKTEGVSKSVSLEAGPESSSSANDTTSDSSTKKDAETNETLSSDLRHRESSAERMIAEGEDVVEY